MTREPVTVLQQANYPVRKAAFLLSAAHAGDAWLQLVNLVMRCGAERSRNGVRLAEVLNTTVTVTLRGGEERLPAFFDFAAGAVDAHYGPLESSLLERLVEGLRRSPDESVVLMEPARQSGGTGAVQMTFNIVDGRLHGSCIISGADVFNVWPLEALSLIRLQREAARRLDIPDAAPARGYVAPAIDSATFFLPTAHILERDWQDAWAKLERWFRRPLPYQSDCAGMFFLSPEDDRVRALLLNPEADKVLWEGQAGDPETLVAYILDAMPWLSAQHMKYLGRESVKLAQAMRDGLPYEQE